MVGVDVDEAEPVRILLRRIMDDPGLPRTARDRAEELLSLADRNASLAEVRLHDLYDDVAPTLPMHPVDRDMCRCVSVTTFFLHHMDEDARSSYRDSLDFLDVLREAENPEQLLSKSLSNAEPLFPAAHSWMTPCTEVGCLGSSELGRVLALVDSEPPYVMFAMTEARLLAAGVAVRRATALDAIPAGTAYWDVDGLPTGITEFVDQDIPTSSLGGLSWRP
jgi:hypothetical protein